MSDRLQPYVNRFMEAALQYLPNTSDVPLLAVALNNVVIDFGLSDRAADGACVMGRGDEKRIFFDGEDWIKFSELKRERLVFHELGHCALGRDHDATHWKERPLSLMTHLGIGAISDEEYEKHRAEYLHELFWGAKLR